MNPASPSGGHSAADESMSGGRIAYERSAELLACLGVASKLVLGEMPPFEAAADIRQILSAEPSAYPEPLRSFGAMASRWRDHEERGETLGADVRDEASRLLLSESPLLERLLASRGDRERLTAVARMIDEALPGGSIVADDAWIMLSALVGTGASWEDPCLRYCLAFLGELAPWKDIWHHQARYGVSFAKQHLESERRSIDVLAAAAERAADEYASADDPSIRALVYLLAGTAGEPAATWAWRASRWIDDDPDEQASATAAQALVAALARCEPASIPELDGRVRAIVMAPNTAARQRIIWELFSGARSTSEEEALRTRFGVTDTAPVQPKLWPLEGI